MNTGNSENVRPVGYNSGKPQLTRPPARRTVKRNSVEPVVIARTETVYMTDQEFDNAVEALAVLLSRHRRRLAARAKDFDLAA